MLWIDSICINQHDNDEKIHQVQQMASIYSFAAIVLAWLGPGSPERDTAIYKLDDLSCRHREAMLRVETSKELSELLVYKEYACLVESLSIGSDLQCDVPIPHIFGFLNKEYWNRVWIQQEIALARDIILVCGETDFDNYHFGPALLVCLLVGSMTSRSLSTTKASHWDLIGLSGYVPEIVLRGRWEEKRQTLTELLLRLCLDQ